MKIDTKVHNLTMSISVIHIQPDFFVVGHFCYILHCILLIHNFRGRFHFVKNIYELFWMCNFPCQVIISNQISVVYQYLIQVFTDGKLSLRQSNLNLFSRFELYFDSNILRTNFNFDCITKTKFIIKLSDGVLGL